MTFYVNPSSEIEMLICQTTYAKMSLYKNAWFANGRG